MIELGIFIGIGVILYLIDYLRDRKLNAKLKEMEKGFKWNDN